MSPMLFKAVIEMIASELDQTIGVSGSRASARKCNYIAFADDLVLVSSTDVGMTRILELECVMVDVGLKMNPVKCASLRTNTHSRQKHRQLHTASQSSASRYPSNRHKHINIYLGIKVGPRLKFISLKGKLQNSFHATSRAPLKPCLYIIKVHLIPSLIHTFMFDVVHERKAAKYDTPDIMHGCRRMPPQTSENQTQL